MSSPPSGMNEILQLMENDLPEGRRQLQESHVNLEKVASYCEGNYMQAMDKRHALEETKSFTTQSLASVAYQINNLANNFLDLLNLQLNQLGNMESSINHLSQTVMIHKEKVARREIGVLTTNKTTSRPPGVKNPGIVFPDLPERPVKYVRKPIDYTVFDEIGHGVKVQQPSQPQRARRTSSTSSKSIPPSSAAPPPAGAPTTKPPTPPATSGIYSRTGGSTGGTLTRQTSSPYRAPAVSPPSVPSHYAPGQGYASQASTLQRQVSNSSTSSYASLRAMQHLQQQQQQQQPPMGLVQPMAQQQMAPPPTPPPPPPAAPNSISGFDVSGPAMMTDPPPPSPLPPPMPEASFGSELRMGDVSPPLPPPPSAQSGPMYDEFNPPPPLHLPPGDSYGAPSGRDFRGRQSSYKSPSVHEDTAEWMPKEYQEKVVAIYDYQKDKDDELSFAEGQVIFVVKKNDDGWWEGVLNGTTGLFPGNYVEPCM